MPRLFIGASCPKGSMGPSERSFTGEVCLQALPHIRLNSIATSGRGHSWMAAEGR